MFAVPQLRGQLPPSDPGAAPVVVGEMAGDVVGPEEVGELEGDTVGSEIVGEPVGDAVGFEVVGVVDGEVDGEALEVAVAIGLAVVTTGSGQSASPVPGRWTQSDCPRNWCAMKQPACVGMVGARGTGWRDMYTPIRPVHRWRGNRRVSMQSEDQPTLSG